MKTKLTNGRRATSSRFVLCLGNNPQQGSENRDPLPNPWAAASGGTNQSAAPNNVLNTPAMQSLMQQMSENPALMQNILNAPYTRTMMESMAADPNMAASVRINSKPLLIPCDLSVSLCVSL